ncbi:histone-lysine N-trimethyltransferase SMYD5 [Magallana gigas]|uniref:histone-lysine N-trimethyltransferase SMYD5 n=1 Tax=Magallana gigas TaxID=29159 RepID=UPI003340C521
MEDELQKCIIKAKEFVDAQNFQKAYEVYEEALIKFPANSELNDGLRNMQENVLERISPKPMVSPTSIHYGDLPGDNVILRHEEGKVKQWLETTDENSDTNQSNSRVHSEMGLEEALNFFKNGEIHRGRHALRSFCNSSDHDVDIVMKSLYDMTLYKECIIYLFTSRHPKKNSVSVWILGAKAAKELSLHATAEQWIRKAFQSDDFNSDDQEELMQLFFKIRTARLFDNLPSEEGIEVNLSEKGRSVRALCSYESQSVIFQEGPVLISQALDSGYDDIPACSHCAKCLVSAEQFFGGKSLKGNKTLKNAVNQFWTNRTPLRCEQCSMELYCSEKCKLDSWKKYHRLICPSQNKHAAKLYEICTEFKKASVKSSGKVEGWWYDNFSPIVLAKLWASILCDANSKVESIEEVVSDVLIAISKRKFDSFQVCSQGGITKRIPKMYDLMVKIFTNKDERKQYIITPGEFNLRYSQVSRNIQVFSDPNHPYFLFRKQVDKIPEMQHLQRILPNTITEAVFTGIFRIQSSLNHSCANNVEIISGDVNEAPGIHVISKRPIKEGDELFTSFVDTSLNRQQRRGLLYRMYHFWCECPRCMFEGDDSDTCTQCRKEADDEKGFPSCGRCHKAWYCSKACQKAAWKKGHKEICLY